MAPDASAQYFGRNKVQYKNLDFQVLKTEHFDIYFYPSANAKASTSPRAWPSAGTRGCERLLDHELRGRQPLVLYASHPDFEQTNAISGRARRRHRRRHRVAPAPHRPAARRAARRHRSRDRPRAGARVPVRHHDQGRRRARRNRRRSVCRCGSSRAWPSTSRSVRSIRTPRCGCATPRAQETSCRTIEELDNPKYFPVPLGPGVLGVRRRPMGRRGRRRDAGDRPAATGDYRAWRSSASSASTARSCRTSGTPSIRDAYQPHSRRDHGRRRKSGGSCIKGGSGIGGDLNVGPAISPDGKLDRVPVRAEPASRSICSSPTRRPARSLRKLTSTATDPHFSSLQFIYSAGGVGRDQPAARDRHGHRRPRGARHLRRARAATRSARSSSRSSTRSSIRRGRPTATRSRSPG